MKLIRAFSMIFAVLLVMLAVFAWSCPAELAYRVVGERLGPLKLSGLSGSVWSGHARSVSFFDQSLGTLDWQLAAIPLTRREVSLHLALSGGSVTASGQIVRRADALVELHDAAFHLPAMLLAPVLDIPSLKPVGEIDGTVARATLQGGWIGEAQGSARWVNPGMSGAIEARFGDIQADFSPSGDGAIAGVIRDLGGALAVSGTFQVRAGQLDSNATLEARDNDPQIIETLRYIGEPLAEGRSLLKIHGQLFKLF